MNYIRHLNGFFERLAEDQRMSSYHISLYMALFQHWSANRFSDQFTISRAEVMKLARIGSANTYARSMKELTGWGYISYLPSSNLHLGSKVACIRFDITGDTAVDTGIKNDTGTDIAEKTATDTGTLGNLKIDTGTGTASGTSITACTENDTGRSTASQKNEFTGIESDTGTDTASDTLLMNITKKNKQEEESSKRNLIEKVSGEEESQKKSSEPKIQIPRVETVRHFFEQNKSSGDDAQKFYAHYLSSGWKTGDMKTIVSWQALARKWIENNQNNRTDERIFNQVRTGNLSVAVNKNYDEPL